MARSKEKTENAIATIRNAAPKSTGRLDFIQLDLADLSTIKASAEEFLRKESKLHMLFNNAGVGYPQKGSKSKQGYELQLGVNCLGTFTFTQYLSPILVSTAKVSPPASVRVVWASSSACEAISVEKFTETYKQIDDNISPIEKYAISKLGDYLYSAEFAARHKLDGVVSVSLNPGNLHSDFFRAQDNFLVCLIQKILLYPTVFGAYTNLFAAFSPEVTMEKSGCHSKSSTGIRKYNDLGWRKLTIYLISCALGKVLECYKRHVGCDNV